MKRLTRVYHDTSLPFMVNFAFQILAGYAPDLICISTTLIFQAPDLAIEHWVRSTALARIVHGDLHWVLAKTHVQLGRAYQQLKGLQEQALMHTTKGRDILLSPSGHMMSHDPDSESVYQLSLAHCIIGKSLTHLERYPNVCVCVCVCVCVFQRATLNKPSWAWRQS